MSAKLLDNITRNLLEDFGGGNPVPGSGSAAALDGLVAAHLTITVIGVTEKALNRSPHYQRHWEELKKIRAELKNELLPQLEYLFEEDSIQFDKVFKARTAYYREKNPVLKAVKEEIHNQELRIATELPIQIARYCFRIGELAAFVFEHGFQKARGDSAGAVHRSVSGTLCGLSIVELNLSMLPPDAWMEKIRGQKQKLWSMYQKLDSSSNVCHKTLQNEADEHWRYQRRMAEFKAGNLGDNIKSDEELEVLVTDLQNMLWVNREKIWDKDAGEFANPIYVLKPHEVLQRFMGYSFVQRGTLGYHYEGTEAFEVAGQIDKSKKLVEVSRQFPVETMRFTAAHELGHAILHRGTVMHRDRAIDGSTVNRNARERQADKFAAFFLMPAKLLRRVFTDIFGVPVFTIDENTVFQLGAGTVSAFREKCVDLRGLARQIATTRRYGSNKLTPLAAIFGVSDETMAIRLEELGLVRF